MTKPSSIKISRQPIFLFAHCPVAQPTIESLHAQSSRCTLFMYNEFPHSEVKAPSNALLWQAPLQSSRTLTITRLIADVCALSSELRQRGTVATIVVLAKPSMLIESFRPLIEQDGHQMMTSLNRTNILMHLE